MVKCPRAKYKLGDMVYSWQNPTVKGRIISMRSPDEYCVRKYKMRVKKKSGGSRNTKWVHEPSLSKRKKVGKARWV